jgi:dTDP-4-dehydrorhamnose 3,5-epimerase
MEARPTQLPDVKLILPPKHGDARGFFSETYNRRGFAALGIDCEFVQDNHVHSAAPATVRGLHYQLPPYAQHKLVRVARGRVLDVAVDLRRGSSSFGRFACAELSASAWNQMFIPIGFAHGYCTLTADAEVLYKVSNYYSPAHERALLWDDPALGIPWPVAAAEAMVSERDRANPPLSRLHDLF